MDKLLSTVTKHSKTKKKPIKVVYISSPMKVKASASEFRAVVQELTGRDAVLPESGDYSAIGSVGSHRTAADGMVKATDDGPHAGEVPRILDPARAASEVPKIRFDHTFEPYDDAFMAQMIENFGGLLPSNFLYETPHVDVLKSQDAV